jgi:hypothetical protein
MAKKLIPKLNFDLNYFKEVKDHVVTGHNGINTAFYIVQPENIESATPSMQTLRMNSFGDVILKMSDEYSLRFYCLQSTFDFEYEHNRLANVISESKNKYIQKTAEVYKGAYSRISDRNNDMRQKTYIIAISSPNGRQKLDNFFDTIRLTLYRSGLRAYEADEVTIQRVFNQIFDLPEDYKGFLIKNQEAEFKANKYQVFNYKKDGSLLSSNWTQIIHVRQTSPTFMPLDPFWLSDLFEINDIFVSFDVDSLEEKKRDAYIGSLKTDFVNVRQYRSQIKNERVQITRELIEHLLGDIARGQQDIKNVTLLIQIRGDTKVKLRKKFEEVKKQLDRMGLIYGNINFRQKEALEFLQPFRSGRRKLLIGIQKDLEMAFPTDAIANAYPFTQTSLFQKDGTLIGIANLGSPMVFNLCDRSKALNGNMIGLGTSGSRKSTLNRLLILGNILNPRSQQTIVVDLENEYVTLAKNFEQQVIEFTRNADKNTPTINIFQIPQLDTWNEEQQKFDSEPSLGSRKNAFISQVSYVENVLKIILSKENEKLNINELNVLNKEIKGVYEEFGIDNKTNFNKIKNTSWPTVDDLYNQIVKKSSKIEKGDKFNELKDYRRMIRLLEPFTEKGVFDGIFNKHTNVAVDEKYKLVVFNMHGLLDQDTPDEIKTAMLMSAMRYCNNIMLDQRKRYPEEKNPNAKYVTFVFDEFHKLVNNRFPQGLELLSAMYAQLRKYYSQIVVTTQSLSTFTKAENEDIKRYLTQILQNSYYKIILGMGEGQLNDLNEIVLYDTGKLTDSERMYLATSSNQDGGKFILFLGEKERISGRIYSASQNDMLDEMIKVPFDEIDEPIQLWQKPVKKEK